MLTRATETVTEQSLLYPSGFISPLEIEDAVNREPPQDVLGAADVVAFRVREDERCESPHAEAELAVYRDRARQLVGRVAARYEQPMQAHG